MPNGEMARVPRRDKNDPTDLEELGILVLGLVLAFCPPLAGAVEELSCGRGGGAAIITGRLGAWNCLARRGA